ncbi:MAG: copper chaperone PCu(A)C [Pseudomonadota bacterium]
MLKTILLPGLALTLLVTLTTPLLAEPKDTSEAPAACECPEGIELQGQPWVRMMPPGMPGTAAYLTLRNHTARDVEIVSGGSPVAATTELHDHIEDERGVMRMREVGSITIPANGQVELQPGGLHVMLIGLQESLAAGQQVPIRLELEGLGTLRLQAEVRDAEQPGMGDHHQH